MSRPSSPAGASVNSNASHVSLSPPSLQTVSKRSLDTVNSIIETNSKVEKLA